MQTTYFCSLFAWVFLACCSLPSAATTKLVEQPGHAPNGINRIPQGTSKPSWQSTNHSQSRQAGHKITVSDKPTLNFWEHMICGAVSRGLAKTLFHPPNVAKTILQVSPTTSLTSILTKQPRVLLRGTAAQFGLSAVQGAVTFAILEETRYVMGRLLPRYVSSQSSSSSATTAAGLDFCASIVSTLCASVVSVPQMVLMDNLMVGNYPNLLTAISSLYRTKGGIEAFYQNWKPHLMGKVPGYALTWVAFKQLKRVHSKIVQYERPATTFENTAMGFLASTTSVCVMMPIEVVKTRMVTRSYSYSSMSEGLYHVATREGLGRLYRGLLPRLVSVVPMTGVNFGIYETLKRMYIDVKTSPAKKPISLHFHRSSNK